jgi:hypothetical protein
MGPYININHSKTKYNLSALSRKFGDVFVLKNFTTGTEDTE